MRVKGTVSGVELGDRVELIHTDDQYTSLQPGSKGTVNLIGAFGTVHVKWDDGSTLGLIAEAGDRWKVVTNRKETA